MKTKLTLCLLAALAVPAVSWRGTVTFEATAGNIAGRNGDQGCVPVR